MDVFERQVLDALPMTVYTVDLEGIITSANKSWSRFALTSGAPQLAEESSPVGTSLWKTMGDEQATEQVERAMELLRTGRSSTVSWEFPRSSPEEEEERIFLMQISALHDGRQITGYVFSTVNITPSHRSREALIDSGIAIARSISLDRVFQEVAQQVRRAIPYETLTIAVADHRSDSGSLRVSYHSGSDESEADMEKRLTGTWQECLDSRAGLVRHADTGIELTTPMFSPGGVRGAITVLAEDFVSLQRIDEAQQVLATLAVQTATAIERAWLVRRVERKRRLEAIGEVAAGIAHELRNPLFGISSAAQLLRFRAREDPVVEKNVGRILREVERLSRMATSLLDFGRPNSLALHLGNPDAVWDDVLDGYRGRMESRSLQLNRTRPEGEACCMIDADQLSQLFVNILTNAIDAAPEASDLELVSTILPNGGWRCRLTNGGPAVPPDVLKRAFEIFFSTKPSGTGIGLALCQRIVEEHGGSIALASTAEAGTTLTITLPPSE